MHCRVQTRFVELNAARWDPGLSRWNEVQWVSVDEVCRANELAMRWILRREIEKCVDTIFTGSVTCIKFDSFARYKILKNNRGIASETTCARVWLKTVTDVANE